MRNSPVLNSIVEAHAQEKKMYWVLLDPDDFTIEEAKNVAVKSQECGVDGLLIGGSLLHSNHFDLFTSEVKKAASVPVLLFPGDSTQLCSSADALLYLSLVSGRNPVNLIGEHVKAAPKIRSIGIEPIATAYMLVESGSVSSVEFMSNTRPLPRNKPGIAAAHALAAQYMGMHLVYLEAGSGAKISVPPEFIKAVCSYIDIPVIVGGGIRDTETAAEKLSAGADIIVTGNMLSKENGISTMKEIASAVKSFS
ncbi:geranylgeranylglyceryl/heptaprenylglyceryl phosphate synthase [Chitinispirillales bacterium ANBcel5]|uniref:geranylgeranylglyceryl/heptaprenylglyceryl phosphate synthase n=1 Tax=Cellulosispirillum alkaliphilum TaxID=3039283 RepID=UPI002A5663EA|nr:geranylgeranylglyceryl/heptaprenylglyceryl phosphate synthase [Chitinispirillales bacterium ANBcel5]